MIVDAVLQAGIALGIRPRLTLQHDAAAIRENEAVLHLEDAALSELDVVIVLADDARALWNEKDAAGGAVIDVLGDLRRHLARQVRTDASDQRRRDDRACLENVRRCRRGAAVGSNGASVDRSIEERLLPLLRR